MRQPSCDRWLVAYADMLTLLFAVFASLYAARIDFLPPSSAATSSIAPVFDSVMPAKTGLMPEDARIGLIQQAIQRSTTLRSLETRKDERGLIISLPEAGTFSAGQAGMSEDAQQMMRDIADILKTSPNQVRVEGHTDNVPIHTAAFASNWELSTARATEVVQFLVERCGIPASRLSAAGFGEYRPRHTNDTDDGRSKNRRVDLIILNAASVPRAPQAAGGGR